MKIALLFIFVFALSLPQTAEATVTCGDTCGDNSCYGANENNECAATEVCCVNDDPVEGATYCSGNSACNFAGCGGTDTSCGISSCMDCNALDKCSSVTPTYMDNACSDNSCVGTSISKPACSAYTSGTPANTCNYGGGSTCTDADGWSACSYSTKTKPFATGNTCSYGCTTCSDTSGWSGCTDDTNNANYYDNSANDGKCYYSCTVSCGASGWSRSGCSSADKDDRNACTTDSCTSTGASHAQVTDGTSCGTLTCPADSCATGEIYKDYPATVAQTCTSSACGPLSCASTDTGCNLNDGYYDKRNANNQLVTQWVTKATSGNDNCKEKEQKQQEYKDYSCSTSSPPCANSVTGTQWTDTGSERNKDNGVACTTSANSAGTCSGGTCSAAVSSSSSSSSTTTVSSDTAPPTVGAITADTVATDKMAALIYATVSDVTGVSSCSLMLGTENLGNMVLSATPCVSCTATKQHTFEAGAYIPNIRCLDAAGNSATGSGAGVYISENGLVLTRPLYSPYYTPSGGSTGVPLVKNYNVIPQDELGVELKFDVAGANCHRVKVFRQGDNFPIIEQQVRNINYYKSISSDIRLSRDYFWIVESSADNCQTYKMSFGGAASTSFKTCGGAYAGETRSINVNGCNVEITPKAAAVESPAGVRYVQYGRYVSQNNLITDIEDTSSGGCDVDLSFKNSWSATGSTLEITSERLSRKGSYQKSHGYGLDVKSDCSATASSGTCYHCTGNLCAAIPAGGSRGNLNCPAASTGATISLLQPDGWTYSTFRYTISAPASTTVPQACGNNVLDTGEVCDNGPSSSTRTQSCEAVNGDDGYKNCKSDCSGYEIPCTLSCNTNAECGDKRCCIAAGPDSTKKTCYSKDVYAPDPSYLCDPGTWMKCDESSFGSRQEFDGKAFVCAKENNVYKWEEKTAPQSDNRDSGFAIDLPNIFSGIMALFASIFVV